MVNHNHGHGRACPPSLLDGNLPSGPSLPKCTVVTCSHLHHPIFLTLCPSSQRRRPHQVQKHGGLQYNRSARLLY